MRGRPWQSAGGHCKEMRENANKGCTEIKLKEIPNIYRKYYAIIEYDEDMSQIYPDKVQHVYDHFECDGHCHRVKIPISQASRRIRKYSRYWQQCRGPYELTCLQLRIWEQSWTWQLSEVTWKRMNKNTRHAVPEGILLECRQSVSTSKSFTASVRACLQPCTKPAHRFKNNHLCYLKKGCFKGLKVSH